MASSPDDDLSGAASRRTAKALAPSLLLLIGLLAIPLLGSEFVAYQIALFLIYGMATQGVGLCWGRLGFLPLGHALFFGLGAYIAGASLKAASINALWWLAVPLGVILPTVLAWGLARLVFSRSSRSGPYFSLITLAMTILGSLAAQQWSSVTGGFNGMGDIPELPGMDRYADMYWLVAAMAFLSTTGLTILTRRPLGVIWSAIAQNEDRLQLFGYATDRIKAAGYALSAALAATAGALFAVHQGIVTPQSMGFVLSTEFVIWAAVGGKAAPLGALLGAVIVGYASAELRDIFSFWEVLIACLFILIVRFLPMGIAGVFSRENSNAARGLPAKVLPAPKRKPFNGEPILSFDAVKASQAGVRILGGLSFSLIGAGIRSIIGPNGAGKTSAFNALTGRLKVRSGVIRLADRNVTGWSAWRVARSGVGRKMQIPSVFPELSVAQNILVAIWAGRLQGSAKLRAEPLTWRTPLCDEMLELFPELAERMQLAAGLLSQGQRQTLELIMTVLPEPQILLLDEPCAGLSPAETHKMIEAIQFAVKRLGAAALLIEHDISAVAAIDGDVFVLHQGQLLAQGKLNDLQADERVQAVYAGARK